MNQPAGKKVLGHATYLGTLPCLPLVFAECDFGEERAPETGGVRGGVPVSLDGSSLWT